MTQSQYAGTTKDTSNLYMVEFQPDVNMFPNYDSSTTISPDTNYTVGSGALAGYQAGWFRIGLTSSSWHGRNPQIVVTINGQEFYMNYGCGFTMVYMTAGDTIRCTDMQNSNSWSKVDSKFFPMRLS